jgi:pimeloyl-ACP methyl ester carboxylesterase
VELGLSDSPLPPDYSVNVEVAALAKSLDALGIGQADFAAWSYGAEITLSFAINHPDRVRSLTLIEPPAMWVLQSRGSLPQELLEEQKALQGFATEDVSEEQLVWFTHFAGFVPKEIDPRTLPSWPSWFKHRQSLRTGDVVFRHQDNIEQVRKFQKPVLLVKGKGSSAFLHQIIDILAEAFPNARVEMLAGGHAAHIISMQPFMELFTRFLSEA